MYFIFDVETIPDIDLLRKTIDDFESDETIVLDNASEELARNKSGFLPPMFHRIVSWVGFWVEHNGDPRGEHKWHGKNEKEGLERFIEVLSKYKDFKLIHHNGKGFDLPLMLYRSMKFGLQLPKRFYHYDLRYRYSNANIDLVDEFSNYGASSWPKLKHLGLLIDLPFKQTGEGNLVFDMYKNEKLKEIEHYCLEDVLATYLIWLHLKYTIGDIDYEQFNNLRERAISRLKEVQNNLP